RPVPLVHQRRPPDHGPPVRGPVRGRHRTRAPPRGDGRMTSFLTIPQTAERLGCGRTHVYDLIAHGDLAVIDISRPGAKRSKTRVPESSIEEYGRRLLRRADDA